MPTSSATYQHMMDIRSEVIKADWEWKLGRPSDELRSALETLQTKKGDVINNNKTIPSGKSRVQQAFDFNAAMKKQVAIQMHTVKQRVMQKIEYKTLLRKQFEQMLQEQAKLNEMLQPILRDLANEEPEVIVKKLNDPDGWVRWVAIQVAASAGCPSRRS